MKNDFFSNTPLKSNISNLNLVSNMLLQYSNKLKDGSIFPILHDTFYDFNVKFITMSEMVTQKNVCIV